MKKFAFLLLVLISAFKVEGTVFTQVYNFEYSSKANIENVYIPAGSTVNFFNNIPPVQPKAGTTVIARAFIRNQMLSLFFYNRCAAHRLKSFTHFFTFRKNYFKIYSTGKITRQEEDDPFNIS